MKIFIVNKKRRWCSCHSQESLQLIESSTSIQNSESTALQFFLTFHIFVTKPREHCIIIFLDILDFVEKLKVEMARRKIDSFSPHNKIFIPWEKTRPKDIRRKWMPINGQDDRGSVYIRKKYSPTPSFNRQWVKEEQSNANLSVLNYFSANICQS